MYIDALSPSDINIPGLSNGGTSSLPSKTWVEIEDEDTVEVIYDQLMNNGTPYHNSLARLGIRNEDDRDNDFESTPNTLLKYKSWT